MKKLLIVLTVISLVFMGCNSEVAEVIEGPAAALQGRWNMIIGEVIVPNESYFIEFKGNIMKCHTEDYNFVTGIKSYRNYTITYT